MSNSTANRSYNPASVEEEGPTFTDKVVFINRCAKVVKGGRRFSFSALVVSGDQNGRVGVGYGKAKEVPEAIRKGTEQAQKHLVEINLNGDTIPHAVLGESDGGVRAVLEAAGIKNILSKSLGSNNHLAVVNATIQGLRQLRSRDQVEKLRSSRNDADIEETVEDIKADAQHAGEQDPLHI